MEFPVFPTPFPEFFVVFKRKRLIFFFKIELLEYCLLPLLNVKLYLSCVSPALMLILPTVSSGCFSAPPQGIMVLTRFHTFFHRTAPSQRSFSSIRSPKSLSRVIRKVRLAFPEMGSVLKVRRKILTVKNPPPQRQHKNPFVAL